MRSLVTLVLWIRVFLPFLKSLLSVRPQTSKARIVPHSRTFLRSSVASPGRAEDCVNQITVFMFGAGEGMEFVASGFSLVELGVQWVFECCEGVI